MSDLDQLVARFDAVVRPHGAPHPTLTSISLGRIEQHFGLVLPMELVWFARKDTPAAHSTHPGSFGRIQSRFQECEYQIQNINKSWALTLDVLGAGLVGLDSQC